MPVAEVQTIVHYNIGMENNAVTGFHSDTYTILHAQLLDTKQNHITCKTELYRIYILKVYVLNM